MDIERVIELCDSARKYVVEMEKDVEDQIVFNGLEDIKGKIYFFEESVAEEMDNPGSLEVFNNFIYDRLDDFYKYVEDMLNDDRVPSSIKDGLEDLKQKMKFITEEVYDMFNDKKHKTI